MGIATRIARRMVGMAMLAENPSLIGLRMHGGVLGNYDALNKPWLTGMNIATILDIGSHTGLFSVTINRVFPHAKIHAFEPLPDCYEKLMARMKNVSGFTGHNMGIGEKSGELPFNRNGSTPSSSFLPMADLHKDSFPHTRQIETVSVKMATLDGWANSVKLKAPLMIKIDVQGYEDRVLTGGESTIKTARVLLIETSMVSLYEGQPLFKDIHRRLSDWGFSYAGALDQMNDPVTGKVLQQDSLFIKE